MYSMDRSTLRLLLLLLVCAALLHACLVVYDLSHPEVFLNADRAITRMRMIEDLVRLMREGASLEKFFGSHGIVGDYLPQAMLFMLGGRPAIIAGQILLFLISLAALFSLTFHLTSSRNCAGLCALVYLLLPHSLVFPHVLCSEAIFDPLVVISFYFTCLVLVKDRGHAAAGSAGLALGIATLVRPITALWPLAVGFAMHLARRSRRSLAIFLILSFLPLLVWMSIMQHLSGAFSLGSSDHDAASNMYQRAERITHTLPEPEQARAEERYLRAEGGKGSLRLSDFLRFAADYPAAYMSHLAKDGIAFIAKSGVEKLVLDYLHVDPIVRGRLQNQETGVRKQLEREGVLRTIQGKFLEYPKVMLASALGALAWMCLVCLAAVGVWRGIVDRGLRLNERITLGLIALFPPYVFLTSQIVTAMQSRHRAPAEFAICLLAVIGLRHLKGWLNRVHGARHCEATG